MALILKGQVEEGIEQSDKAMRLSPFDPAKWTFLVGKALGLLILGRHEESIECGEQATTQAAAGFWTFAVLAAAQALIGRQSEAAAYVAQALDLKPDLTVAFLQSALPFALPEQRDVWLGGLRKAGLPE